MESNKKEKHPPRVRMGYRPGSRQPFVLTLTALRMDCEDHEYLSLSEHQQLLREAEEKGRREFQQGYACAVSCMVKGHGPETQHREALQAAGLTSADLARAAGVDEYDIKILEPLFREIREQAKAARPAEAPSRDAQDGGERE